MLKRMRKIMLILLSVLMLHSLLPVVNAQTVNDESTPSIISNNGPLFEKEGGLIFSIGLIGNGSYGVKINGNVWLSDENIPNKDNFDIVQNLELIAKAAEGYSFAGWFH